MGIFKVKSKTCNCKGNWSTLDANDHRVYMNMPCLNHEFKEGNMIYYELIHILKHITIPQSSHKPYKYKYLVKVLEKQKIQNHKYIVKIELKDYGDINIDNFMESKQMYFSQMNNEPMWKRIDNDTIQLVLLYQSPHHTVESGWDPEDY
jgi:hypothetical protein